MAAVYKGKTRSHSLGEVRERPIGSWEPAEGEIIIFGRVCVKEGRKEERVKSCHLPWDHTGVSPSGVQNEQTMQSLISIALILHSW